MCGQLDAMLSGKTQPPQIVEEESLFYKINHRLVRLYDVMRENQRSAAKERADLQELISDISHQVKMPIANLKMIDTTLLEQSVSGKKREFLAALGGILLGAEKKDIHVNVSCPEELEIPHDRKWTSEALFNVLDNAVKYTPAGGSISVCGERDR